MCFWMNSPTFWIIAAISTKHATSCTWFQSILKKSYFKSFWAKNNLFKVESNCSLSVAPYKRAYSDLPSLRVPFYTSWQELVQDILCQKLWVTWEKPFLQIFRNFSHLVSSSSNWIAAHTIPDHWLCWLGLMEAGVQQDLEDTSMRCPQLGGPLVQSNRALLTLSCLHAQVKGWILWSREVDRHSVLVKQHPSISLPSVTWVAAIPLSSFLPAGLKTEDCSSPHPYSQNCFFQPFFSYCS